MRMELPVRICGGRIRKVANWTLGFWSVLDALLAEDLETG